MTTPAPDFLALCEELADNLTDHCGDNEHSWELIERARAALDTPPPEPPTDEELYNYWILTSPQFGCADPVGFARAVIERWGN